MAYTLQLTNGNTLVVVPDQTVDQQSTSLTLIGKNSNAYGTALNDNFIGLLENFANSSEPRAPLVGQLWFNTIAGRMYYYNTSFQFRPVGGPIVSATVPASPVAGDLWVDTANNQLKYYDGLSFNVAGPAYSKLTGKAGWLVETVADSTLVPRTFASLYANGSLLAIASNQAFNFNPSYQGFSSVSVGINFNQSIPGNILNGLATSATTLVSNTGAVFSATDFISATASTVNITGDVRIKNHGLSLGGAGANNLNLYYQDALSPYPARNVISSNVGNAELFVDVSTVNSGTYHAIQITPTTNTIALWPQYHSTARNALDVWGSVNIRGSLNVAGTQTIVNSTVLQIKDPNIELAYPSLPDQQLDGAGIILHGTTDHTILYRTTLNGWEFNNSVNIKAPAVLYMDGAQVFTQGGSGLNLTNVTGAPDLVSIGTLTNIRVGNVAISTSSIYTVDNSDLVLNTRGTGNISISGKKIRGSAPTLLTDSTSTLATKGYVDSVQQILGSSRYILTADITGKSNPESFIISKFLNFMLPPVDPRGGIYNLPDQTECRVNTLNYILPGLSTNVVFNGQYINVDKGGVQNSQPVLYGTPGISVGVIAGQQPTCIQSIYRFYVSGGNWISDPSNPIG